MNDDSTNSNNRKRTLISLVVAFLLIGGGVFTFLIFQGLGDLKGDNKGTFSYGFAARNIVLPITNYFSLGDNDLVTARRTGEKLTVKGTEPSLLDGSSADISDWMAKGEPGTSAGRSSSSSQPAGRTSIPKMGGGLGSAVGGGGSGGSKSSGSPSQFSGGPSASNTSVTGAKDGKGLLRGKSGTLNALSSARAALSDGLKSGSAMTAKSKWDQGFGLGSTGKKTGDLAYGKAGLVGLDHIKKGDISDLKMTGVQSLKISEPKPERDTVDGLNNSKVNSSSSPSADNSIAQSLINAIGQGASKALSGSPDKDAGPDKDKDPDKNKDPDKSDKSEIKWGNNAQGENSLCGGFLPPCETRPGYFTTVYSFIPGESSRKFQPYTLGDYKLTTSY